MNKIRLFLDVSTSKTGYSVYQGKQCIDSGSYAPKGDWLERANLMRIFVENLLKKYSFNEAYVEDTYSSINVASLKKLCIVQGIVIGSIQSQNSSTPISFVVPKKWQAFYKWGNKKRIELKSLSIEEALKRFPINSKDNDQADAVNMGYFVVNNEVSENEEN